jgi:hypothetical protein
MRVEVEHDVADLAAGALDELDLLVLAQVLGVGGRQAAVGHVDVAVADRELQVRRVGEVLDVDLAVGGLAELALVAGVRLVGDELVLLVVGDLVLTGEGLALDDGVVIGDLVGREDLLVDDRAAGLERMSGQIWSLPFFSVKTTVVGSGAAVLSRLPSSDAGPLGSLILTMRSKENFTTPRSAGRRWRTSDPS